jgi:hypothetical protein
MATIKGNPEALKAYRERKEAAKAKKSSAKKATVPSKG